MDPHKTRQLEKEDATARLVGRPRTPVIDELFAKKHPAALWQMVQAWQRGWDQATAIATEDEVTNRAIAIERPRRG